MEFDTEDQVLFFFLFAFYLQNCAKNVTIDCIKEDLNCTHLMDAEIFFNWDSEKCPVIK